MQAQKLSSSSREVPSFPVVPNTAAAPGRRDKIIPLRPARRSWLIPWRQATLAVFPLFIVTRIAFVLLTYFGVILFSVPNYSMHALDFQTLLNAWARWDAVRFTTIATRGYLNLSYAAFFPLYPWLIHVFSIPPGADPLVTGMVISNLAFLAALIVLYRLVETEFNREVAQKTALYLTIFPTALFFFAAYNESLFILLVLLCFYALRRGFWWLAGLCAGLATLTRSAALLLAIPFLYEFARQALSQLRGARIERRKPSLHRLIAGLPALLLIPLGLGIYAWYLNQRYHDPLAFEHAQVYWRYGFSAPWAGTMQQIHNIITLPLYTFFTAHDIIDLTALLFALVLLVLCFIGPVRFSRSQWSMPLFCLLVLFLPLFFPGHGYDPLQSTQRFVLELFAVFIVLARLGQRYSWLNQWYMMLALPMLAFLTLQFLHGYWTV
ncbi:MAG TPA: mannosyltransferase family protein [Ktedonobacteraceae bacterium]|nr:mannosyltransferase family protein [Ktedonobacteraceae bacterium]